MSSPESLPPSGFALPTRFRLRAANLVLAPGALLVTLSMTYLASARLPSPDDLWTWPLLWIGVVWLAVGLVGLRLSRGADFGYDSTGVWLRPSMWSRRERRFAWERVRHIEIVDVRRQLAFIGVRVRVETDDGRVPRRLGRFVQCRAADAQTVRDALRGRGLRVRD